MSTEPRFLDTGPGFDPPPVNPAYLAQLEARLTELEGAYCCAAAR